MDSKEVKLVRVEELVIDEIKEIIKNQPDFWDCKTNSKKNHIHNLIRYPATMVPFMQAKLIELFLDYDQEMMVLLDPFMGSGTTIVEANNKGINTIGIDINPFAYLISKVKLTSINLVELKISEVNLIEKIKSCEEIGYNFWFDKINKWFKAEVINELSIIKHLILEEKNIDIRCVMWIAFSRTVQAVSNDRESTFKLHAKAKEEIEQFNIGVKEHFIKSMERTVEICEEYYTHYYQQQHSSELYCGNSIQILKDKIKDESIDIISTSPPYGDNATTVTYGQYSMLQLRWLPVEDLHIPLDEDLLKNYSSLDRNSLGGISYTVDKIEKSGILKRSDTLYSLYTTLQKRDLKKARKVVSFYIDYENILYELFRVVKNNKYLVFTVGNRKVDDEIVSLDKVTIELSEHFDGKCVYQFERNILNKRMPMKVSKLKNNKSVTSMKKETILLFVKRVP